MNHPYLYPDQAPWTDDYHELIQLRSHHYNPMQNLGQFPTRSQFHLAITEEEQDALVNALSFFHDYFGPGQTSISDWRDVANDQRLELFQQLSKKIATL
jgi:hypothetical protein